MTIVIVKSDVTGTATTGATMAGEVRARMIEGAVQLLAQHGLQATSFSEVLALTAAPRGSVYHHFPHGKDQLVGEAVDLAGARAIGLLDQKAGASVEEITIFFLEVWRQLLMRSHLSAGCAVAAVTVATDSPDLLQHAATVFRSWRTKLSELLEQGGLDHHGAELLAATLVAACEGAVVVSRAEQNMEPFELVAEQLTGQARLMVADVG